MASGSYSRYSGWCKNEYNYRMRIDVSWSSNETYCDYTVNVYGESVQFTSNYTYVDIYIAGANVGSTTRGSLSPGTTKWQASGSKRIYRSKSNQSISISAYMRQPNGSQQVYRDGIWGSADDTLGALASYTVSYNANGGSGAPSSQTKWYGENLTLSGTKPTKSGYIFQGWATSSTGSVAYQAGGTYSSNSDVTLYAVWKANTVTCTIAYNANGGSGAPSNQTHIKGSSTKLSSTKPTRTNYVFLGWSTSSTATSATYLADGYYINNSITQGATITLYAVWAKVPAYVHISVPDGKSLKGLYVNIPSGSYSGIYFKTG